MVAERVLAEGKTKWVLGTDEPRLCLMRNKPKVTKNDNPDETMDMPGKDVWATTTTCRMFELLAAAGLPVAYKEQVSSTEFSAPHCNMISLECVARRFARGSYLQRHPDTKDGLRFHRLKMEFYLKTSQSVLRRIDGSKVHMNLAQAWVGEQRKSIEDPYIINPYDAGIWKLRHPKLPEGDPTSRIEDTVPSTCVMPEGVSVAKLEELTRRAFLVLEGAWALWGYALHDIKFEFGIDADGNLYIADVVDADSWRMKSPTGEEVSKQIFRDCKPNSEMEAKYRLAAEMAARLHIPKQAFVLWRGSKDDELPKIPDYTGLIMEDIVCSAHKNPDRALAKIEELRTRYPSGGVILALVGMSNGLGPMLAARMPWPVIGVPMDAKAFPEDVWSSLRLPSNVPMSTVLSPKNAVLAALNALSASNPAAYACRQYAIEELDK
jgi:phosphoribosylaminoimidazole carboxylase / phosphoribosylaminoimidazole-succinocarboxamide synthase